MEINGILQKHIEEALLSAFPTRPDLEMMISHRLHENLAAIAGDGPLQHIVFKLVQWAMARGRLKELVIAARKQNPQNPQLIIVARQLGLEDTSGTPKGSKQSPTLTCTVHNYEKLKYGFIYKFHINNDDVKHILKLVAGYDYKNTLYLDNREIFRKQIGYFDSIGKSIEAHIAGYRGKFEYPIFWCTFIIDGHILEYFYYCNKINSHSKYKILIKKEQELLFEQEGHY